MEPERCNAPFTDGGVYKEERTEILRLWQIQRQWHLTFKLKDRYAKSHRRGVGRPDDYVYIRLRQLDHSCCDTTINVQRHRHDGNPNRNALIDLDRSRHSGLQRKSERDVRGNTESNDYCFCRNDRRLVGLPDSGEQDRRTGCACVATRRR